MKNKQIKPGERIAEALGKIYKTDKNSKLVAADFDEYQSNVDRLKRGGTVTKAMKKIANKKGISIDWLENGIGNMFVNEGMVVKDAGILYSEMITVPYHQEVYASAGGGSDNHSMENTSPVTFSRQFLNSFLGIYNLSGLSIINAAGDSMDPTIKSGELMFVCPMKNEEFKDGGIYVLMCSNVLLVKRVTFDPLSKKHTLISDNGTVAPVTLTIDESNDCRWIGRVVGHLDRV